MELGYGQWFSGPSMIVRGDDALYYDWDYLAIYPVLGTHTASAAYQRGPASASASTTVTGVESEMPDEYLLQLLPRTRHLPRWQQAPAM